MDDLTPPDGVTPDDRAATPLAVRRFIGVLLRQHLAALQQHHLLQRAMPIQATFHVLLLRGARWCDAPEGLCQELLAHEEALWTFVRRASRTDQQRSRTGAARSGDGAGGWAGRDDARSSPRYESSYHNDHLGSASVATTQAQARTQQEYDPWGKVRSGGISQTSINYTGQRLDGTGLLYYHARMYDPLLGRFVSADSVVPGSASGSMEGIALKPLTVDFHEPGIVLSLNSEDSNAKLYRGGPLNPQTLNRYSYVQNNSLKYTDPNGHSVYLTHEEANTYVARLRAYAQQLRDNAASLNWLSAAEGIPGLILLTSPLGSVVGAGAGFTLSLGIAAGGVHWKNGNVAGIPLPDVDINGWADTIDKYANFISDANQGSDSGVIISLAPDHGWGNFCAPFCRVTIVSRDTGNGVVYDMPAFPGRWIFSGPRVDPQGGLYDNPSVWEAGHACTYARGNPTPGNYYSGDHALCH